MEPASVRPARLKVGGNGTLQHLTLKKVPTDPYPSSICPKISQCITLMYDRGAFKTVASALRLGKNTTLNSYSPLVFPSISPLVFKGRLLELFFLVQVPQTGAWRPHSLKGSSVVVLSLPLVSHHTGSRK